jgi:hypothetical protein
MLDPTRSFMGSETVRNLGKNERPPLKAVTRGLLKIQWTKNT